MKNILTIFKNKNLHNSKNSINFVSQKKNK